MNKPPKGFRGSESSTSGLESGKQRTSKGDAAKVTSKEQDAFCDFRQRILPLPPDMAWERGRLGCFDVLTAATVRTGRPRSQV